MHEQLERHAALSVRYSLTMTGKPSDASEARPSLEPEGSQPDIVVSYKPAGRETLEAITGELVPLPASFERDAAAKLERVAPAKVARESSSPEIIVREGTIERDTLAAIVAEAASAPAEAKPSPPSGPAPVAPVVAVTAPATAPELAALEIFEMTTYVVRGGDVARLASENLRRHFVEEHLLARLPVTSMAEVERVDVTPWTVPGTLVVRVWCRTK